MELGGRMETGPRTNLLHFDVDPDKGVDPEILI